MMTYEISKLSYSQENLEKVSDLTMALQAESNSFEIADLEIDEEIIDEDSPAITIVAKADDCFVGMGSIANKEVGVAVLNDYQNQGLAQKMLTYLIDWAKENDLDYIWLDVFANNDVAKHIYEKFGFQKIGQAKEYQDVKGNSVFLEKMQLDLG